MNKKSAEEWLEKSWHHLSTAKLLFEVEHYTDVIAVEIHYHIMFLLKNLNTKELKIIEDNGSNRKDDDVMVYANHTANTIEDWHDECEDWMWK